MLHTVIALVSNQLNVHDIANLQLVDTRMYMSLFETMQTRYREYTHSDDFKHQTLRMMNHTATMIDAFKQNNTLLTNMMYEYVIACYEHWHWIIMENFRGSLVIPKCSLFKQFLHERNIRIKDVLPEVRVTYTHHHRPTKSYSYYKCLN